VAPPEASFSAPEPEAPARAYAFDGPRHARAYNAPLARLAAGASARAGIHFRPAAGALGAAPEAPASPAPAEAALSLGADAQPSGGGPPALPAGVRVGWLGAAARASLARAEPLLAAARAAGGCGGGLAVLDAAAPGAAGALGAGWLAEHLVPARPLLLRGALGGSPAGAAAARALAPGALASGALRALPAAPAVLPAAARLGLPAAEASLGAWLSALASCGARAHPAPFPLAPDFNASALCPLLTAEPAGGLAAGPRLSTPPPAPSAPPASPARGLASGRRRPPRSEYASAWAGAGGLSAAGGGRLSVALPLRYSGPGASPAARALLGALAAPLAFALNASLPVWRGQGARAGAASSSAAAAAPLAPLLPPGDAPGLTLLLGGPGSGTPVSTLSARGGEAERLWALGAGAALLLLQRPSQAHMSSVPMADHLAAGLPAAEEHLACAAQAGDLLYIPRGWGAGALYVGDSIATGFQLELVTPLSRY